MLSALPFTTPELVMQLSRGSVSELGDVVLAAVFSCDSTPDLVKDAEIKQVELETRRPASAPSLKAEVQRDWLETCRPTSAPSLEADGTPASQLVPTGTICSTSHVAASMEVLAIDEAEIASQVQLT